MKRPERFHLGADIVRRGQLARVGLTADGAARQLVRDAHSALVGMVT